MKRSIVLGLMAVMAISGCQVKEIDEFASDGKPFTATMEAIVDDVADVDTKTSLDASGNVRWKRGDQVSIFAGSTVNEHYQVTDASDGKTAAALSQIEITGFVAGGEISNNVAFYPYAATAEIAKGDGNSYVISDIALPAIQTYAKSSFGNGAFPMVAVTSSPRDYNLKFKNVLGGLKLQLKGTATVTSISIKGNNNDKLCGAAELTVSVAAAPAITLTDALAKTVTLDCGGGVQLNANTATAFIIALPPMVFSGGFTVTVTDTENQRMEIKTTKRQTIARSSLLSMPTVTYEGTSAPDPFDVGSDLSVNGTANCYVVTKAGDFSFDASVMGNGPDGFLWDERAVDACLWPQSAEKTIIANGSLIPSRAFVLWNDGDVVTNVKYNITAKTISFTATGNKGAALIGLYDRYSTAATAAEDNAIWSWLIWCTDAPSHFTHYDNDGNQYVLLDRNIGAISADPNAADITDTYGYYFQWGRPNPIKAYIGMAVNFNACEEEMYIPLTHPTYTYNEGTKTREWYNTGHGLSRVTADLWGNPMHLYATVGENGFDHHPNHATQSELRKTTYDPCPPGYLVAPERTWELAGLNEDDGYSITFTANGALIQTENGNSFYPFAGYISALTSGETGFESSLGWYGFKGYENVLPAEGTPGLMCWDFRHQASVYSSCTGSPSPWLEETVNWNCYGAKYLYLSPDGELFEQSGTLLGTVRQRAFPVRCVKEFNN